MLAITSIARADGKPRRPSPCWWRRYGIGVNLCCECARSMGASQMAQGLVRSASTYRSDEEPPLGSGFGECILYARLGQGSSKLDAFRFAQPTLRAAFPAYRDWGAFHYARVW